MKKTVTFEIPVSHISNYELLNNKPKINGVELKGDKSGDDLGLLNSEHNEDTEAHPHIQDKIGTDIEAHNTDSNAHEDIRSGVAYALSHSQDTNNPHSVTKSQVGLGSVPNLDTTAAVANQHTHENKSVIDGITSNDISNWNSKEEGGSVAAHDTSGSAHSDIRAKIGTDIVAHDTSNASHADIRSDVATARSIAEGRSQAKVFADLSAMQTWLLSPVNTATLNTGDNLLIIELDVPDYWWDGTQAQKLETEKVDLTDYFTKSEINSLLSGKVDTLTFTAHTGNTNNPHSVTKSQVGLGSVPNLDTTAAVANQHTHENKPVIDGITSNDISNWNSKEEGGSVAAHNTDSSSHEDIRDLVIVEKAGINWTAQQAAEANSWRSVCYGKGLFVAVTNYGTSPIMTSPDGINWTARQAEGAVDLFSVCYGNGMFVAVSGDGTNHVATSEDGITWEVLQLPPANRNWRSVCYGNGMFVAVDSEYGCVMTSPDGINWTKQFQLPTSGLYSVCFGNGLFVAVYMSGANRVITSEDGINWVLRQAAEENNWISVCYGKGMFVAVSTNGTNRVMTSEDGINWTARQAAEANSWYSVCYGKGMFVAVTTNGTNRVMTSEDGINWTARQAAEANYWVSVCHGNGLFVAVSTNGTNRVMTSHQKTLKDEIGNINNILNQIV